MRTIVERRRPKAVGLRVRDMSRPYV